MLAGALGLLPGVGLLLPLASLWFSRRRSHLGFVFFCLGSLVRPLVQALPWRACRHSGGNHGGRQTCCRQSCRADKPVGRRASLPRIPSVRGCSPDGSDPCLFRRCFPDGRNCSFARVVCRSWSTCEKGRARLPVGEHLQEAAKLDVSEERLRETHEVSEHPLSREASARRPYGIRSSSAFAQK